MDNPKTIEVQLINAFVDNEQGGNPAGVVLQADNLTSEQKLQIARKVGLSETAFVSNSVVADCKLDFFTPTRQIAHCGHATIATFSYLSQQGFIGNGPSSKETIDGRREILVQGDMAFMEQQPPVYREVEDYSTRILDSLGLKGADRLMNAPLSIVNTGNSFLLLAVTGIEVLKRIQPDFDLITQLSEELDLVGYYVFTTATENPVRDAASRMFAPRYGIKEEAGTGMAAGPLACYLYDQLAIRKERFLIQQGAFMNPASTSLIMVELSAEKGLITKVMAGGKGIPKASMIVEL
ncbi:PhzF family phenazine biosynthesis protein [Flavihumibacter cheonanensis]|uniref:PhzF family phenazine biosynthesis protein n=1 Tax=Flavihumibacter cheonanensis TaxID=1442385 RepID=UPI001EF91144|nr:PhzF family phenazine biosynthesis protein [Flavihumibacter cheonanensis]MCG7754502.1 PhzF family phenazine biosynthesis protein [Flavihumibacter cheonanensis]